MEEIRSEPHDLGSEQTLLTCAVEVPVRYSGGLEGSARASWWKRHLSLQGGRRSEDRDRRRSNWERSSLNSSIHPSIHPTLGQPGPVISSGRHRAEHAAALPSIRSSWIDVEKAGCA